MQLDDRSVYKERTSFMVLILGEARLTCLVKFFDEFTNSLIVTATCLFSISYPSLSPGFSLFK